MTKIKGIWPFKKNRAEQIKEILPLIVEYLPKIKEAMRNKTAEPDTFLNGQVEGCLYDWYVMPWGEQETMERQFLDRFANASGTSDFENVDLTEDDPLKRKDALQIATKRTPKEVFEELERVPLPDEYEALPQRIATLEKKLGLVNQIYSENQIKGALERLRNRLRMPAIGGFFNQFPYTTDEKVHALCEKYDLQLGKSDLFIPTFPKEAIDVMDAYREQCENHFDKKPIFYVIASPDDFKAKRDRLDPILLVQSPFAFMWQILGAWDKEMLLLHEL